VTPKRRLPVLSTADDAGEPPRPPWQWAFFGAGLIVLVWVVLAALSAPLLRGLPPSWLARAAAQLVVQALASFASGWVIGAWSPRRGVGEAAAAGALSAGFAALFSVVSMAGAADVGWADFAGALAGGAALLPSATAAAALGGLLGSKKKRVLEGP